LQAFCKDFFELSSFSPTSRPATSLSSTGPRREGLTANDLRPMESVYPGAPGLVPCFIRTPVQFIPGACHACSRNNINMTDLVFSEITASFPTNIQLFNIGDDLRPEGGRNLRASMLRRQLKSCEGSPERVFASGRRVYRRTEFANQQADLLVVDPLERFCVDRDPSRFDQPPSAMKNAISRWRCGSWIGIRERHHCRRRCCQSRHHVASIILSRVRPADGHAAGENRTRE
jgi:hypothetical protein